MSPVILSLSYQTLKQEIFAQKMVSCTQLIMIANEQRSIGLNVYTSMSNSCFFELHMLLLQMPQLQTYVYHIFFS